ncbi:MAG: sugar-binding transcriptional regulator, partial [Albidovulum sp.]|uniref:sugar-binding transcriptional regulator n=1 Tax=Albidovulum sp. TaxID=1872424 RepID=UPI003CBFD621
QNISDGNLHGPTGITAIDEESGLAARAAWLYFSGGLTQGEIAKRLAVPSTKAHRLIARATREGLVRVFVDASVSECVALEEGLSARYGLEYCRVAPDLGETGLPLRALGLAGATFLRQALEGNTHNCIGIGHGRTLAATVNELPSLRGVKGSVVSLLGGLTRKFAANPFDVIYRLAEKTGAEAYLLPVPLYANSAADREVLLAQMGVGQVFDKCRSATLLIVGIGDVGSHAHLSEVGTVTSDEMEELRSNGAVGEILGHYLDRQGAPVATSLSGRVMAPPIEELANRMVVAVAGGEAKTDAIRAVLTGGLLKGLITDEATARRLAEAPPAT